MRRLTVLVFVCLIFVAPGVTAAESEQRFVSADVQSDFDELYARLAKAHFDLYARRPKADYDALFARMRASFVQPRTALEVRIAYQRFMAFGRVAHSRIDFPSEAFGAYRDGGGRTMPLFVRVVNGRGFVVGNGSDVAIAPGEELVALNGTPMRTWLERLAANVSADNDYMMGTLLENRFAQLLWLELGPVGQFSVSVRNGAGAARDVVVAARTRDEIKAALARQSPSLDLSWDERVFKMVGDVGYLRPGPFYNNDPNATNIWDTTQFKTFIDASFGTLLREKARTVLIDLRDNPGGDNSFSDLLVAWYASKPFRFAKDFRIKVSAEAIEANRQRVVLAPDDTASISYKFAQAYARHLPGEVFSFEIPEIQPHVGARFAGKVYLLINRHSYSNTVQVAASSQDYGFATIMGEETSDLATTIGAMEQFTLTRTGIAVGFPKAQIVRVNGDMRARGVAPDIAIETPIVEGSNDPVLQRALAIAAAR